jgi:D-glycero-alpha-D-manno-heptose-7-phosphate kinase
LRTSNYVKELRIRSKSGAIGGKLVGASGGGSLMFSTEDPTKLRHAMFRAGLSEVRFRFAFEGTKVIP